MGHFIKDKKSLVRRMSTVVGPVYEVNMGPVCKL